MLKAEEEQGEFSLGDIYVLFRFFSYSVALKWSTAVIHVQNVSNRIIQIANQKIMSKK